MIRWLAALILALVLGGAILYNVRSNAAPPVSSPQAGSANAGLDAIAVTTAPVQRGVPGRTLTISGVLRSERQAAVSALIPARITAVLVHNGTRVRRGQPVVHLDASSAKAQSEGAAAAVESAHAQLNKAQEGKRAKYVEMDAKVSEAEAGLRTARARLAQAEAGAALSNSSAVSDSARAAAAVEQARAGLEQAQSGYAQAEKNLSRLEFLLKHGGVPRVEVDGARTQLEIARSQQDAAAAALKQAQAAAKPAGESIAIREKVGSADVEAARAGVHQAEEGIVNAKRARTEALRLADRDIEAADAQVSQAQASATQAAAQAASSLTSPADGVIVEVTARQGDVAQPGVPLLTIATEGRLVMEASVPARDAALLLPGQRVSISAESLPGTTVAGEVERVLPSTDPEGRDLPVRIRLLSSPKRLAAGVAAKASASLPDDPAALTVPAEAVRSDATGSFVFVEAAGVARRRSITLGAAAGSRTRIVSGLHAGDSVIVGGPISLADGVAVRAASH